jgi:sterol desaturase/sphingolipid hydroxylase (fatty acid hydroxylase superfamily)
MEHIIQYFSDIPSSHRTIILVGGLVFFWMIEGILPLTNIRYPKWKHAGLNLFFTLTTVIVNFALATAILHTSDWTVAHHFGLLQWLDLQWVNMPLWIYMLLGLMGLDLIGAYFIHWLQHKIKWMWRFHLIHHTDTHVDTTTANRHHPGESVFRVVFSILAVLIIGTPMWLVMLYQSLSALLSQFNHADIRLPKTLDKVISWVIISPDMHKVHHHYVQPYTDTNYGNIFSFWDRIFGTSAFVEDMKTLKYGIDTHLQPEENAQIGNLLKIPFQPYRPPLGAKFNEEV